MERCASNKLMTVSESLHRALQYLATASKSFLPPKDDDSHTSVGWNSVSKSFETHPFNKSGLALALNLEVFSLDFIHPVSGIEASFPLEGAKHLDIVNWIERERLFCKIDEDYKFELHYDLPYDTGFDDSLTYPKIKEAELKSHIQLRWLANKSLELASSHFDVFSDIRVWPHHFDTGAIGYQLNEKGSSFGLGLSIPDNVSDDYYFYVSKYNENESVNVSRFSKLKNGEWKFKGWNGAALDASGKSLPGVISFFSEAIKGYSE